MLICSRLPELEAYEFCATWVHVILSGAKRVRSGGGCHGENCSCSRFAELAGKEPVRPPKMELPRKHSTLSYVSLPLLLPWRRFVLHAMTQDRAAGPPTQTIFHHELKGRFLVLQGELEVARQEARCDRQNISTESIILTLESGAHRRRFSCTAGRIVS